MITYILHINIQQQSSATIFTEMDSKHRKASSSKPYAALAISSFIVASLAAFTLQVFFFSPISPDPLHLPPPSVLPINKNLQVNNLIHFYLFDKFYSSVLAFPVNEYRSSTYPLIAFVYIFRK